jgi:hypothetical protein
MLYIRFTKDISCIDPKWEWSLNKPLLATKMEITKLNLMMIVTTELPMKKPGRENEGCRDQAGHHEQEEGYRSIEHSTEHTCKQWG